MKTQIILASASPRRARLLKKIVKKFGVFHSSVKEEKIKEKNPIKFALAAAAMKAKDVGKKNPASLVIGADTIVVLAGKIFGKPKNHNEARRMLAALSGRTHKVITAFAVYNEKTDKIIADYEVTKVTFKKFKKEEIENYLINYEVLDKAGSYAIQEMEEKFIEKIEGDYDNVVGLPVKKLEKVFAKIKYF